MDSTRKSSSKTGKESGACREEHRLLLNGSARPNGSCCIGLMDNAEFGSCVCDLSLVDNNRNEQKCDALNLKFDIDTDGHDMHYKVSDVPSYPLCCLFGLQVNTHFLYKNCKMYII